MATLIADVPLNMTDLNFYRVTSGYVDSNFYPDANETIYGRDYADVLEVEWKQKGSYLLSVFGGYGLTTDGSGNVTGGTVTGYLETYWNGSDWVAGWGIEDASVSATSLYAAFKTSSTADDYAIIKQILSGDDSITGSTGKDVLIGYGGDDLMAPSKVTRFI